MNEHIHNSSFLDPNKHLTKQRYYLTSTWTTPREEQQSAPASIRKNQSQNVPQDSTDAQDPRPQQDRPSRDVAEVLWTDIPIVQRPTQAGSPLLIRQLQQVGCVPISEIVDFTKGFTAAAAAKINAQIQAKKGIQHVDVPPIRSVRLPSTCLLSQTSDRSQQMMSPDNAKPASPGAGNSTGTVNSEMYIADGDYIRDIEVNDLRNRYTLTKGSTQKMVNTPCVNVH